MASDDCKDAWRRQCPDGSWSKWLSRRCVLPFGHTGPHRYEMRVVPHTDEAPVAPRGNDGIGI